MQELVMFEAGSIAPLGDGGNFPIVNILIIKNFPQMHELEKSMYYGATPAIFERAYQLRKNMTLAEELLWNKLQRKQILGVRFRRQHPISRYIVDFYCHTAKLVIEVDGKIHLAKKEQDRLRTKEIEDSGLRIIRFTNEEVEENIDNVVAQITAEVMEYLNLEE